MGGLDPIGKKKLPSLDDIEKGFTRPDPSWGLRMFQAGVIGATPALLQRLQEQALGYASVNATKAAMETASFIGLVHWLTIAGALFFMLAALLHWRRKTPHALMSLLVCGATFAASAVVVGAETDEAWATEVRAEQGPCQDFFRSRKGLGQDGTTQSFMVGACMAHVDVVKEGKIRERP